MLGDVEGARVLDLYCGTGALGLEALSRGAARATFVDTHTALVRRNVSDMDGVDEVLEADRYADALPGADLVVVALALTPETDGIIASGELELMERAGVQQHAARQVLLDPT